MDNAPADAITERRVGNFVTDYSRRWYEKAIKILTFTGRDSKQAKTIDEIIKSVAEREKMIYKEGSLSLFAIIADDHNKAHAFSRDAKDMGFKEPPIYGSLIAARAEQYVLSLLEEINILEGNNLSYEGHRIEFKRPLYYGKRADWKLKEVKTENSGINLVIHAYGPDNKAIIESEARLGLEREKPSSNDTLPFLSDRDVVIRRVNHIGDDYDEDESEIKTLYRILGKKPKKEIPMMRVAFFIPSALLDLVSKRTGKPEGGYSYLDLDFYNSPSFGSFETIIKKTSHPTQRRERYHYIFEVFCLQDNKPILGGEVGVYTKEKFDL